ncbi:MAG: TIGR02221 family CRISPR-associated protein [Dehalococcoidia bacterium]|nr:TIGR02221 family CRISPR-associated protein [Dehalococcoidia bacterium]
MPIVAIAALGTTAYNDVRYRFANGATIRSSYPIHAFLQQTQLQLDETIVLLTEGARQRNWELMNLFLADVPAAGKVRGIDIPDGKNEEELWTLFTTITEVVPANADLYVDITHGLRHLPTFLLMACAYLRVAKDVNVRSIYYGAFELGVRETIDGKSMVVECPIIELAPFVALFDWASAAAAFKASGDATLLEKRLLESASTATDDQKRLLQKISARLQAARIALEVAQPSEAIKEIRALQKALSDDAQSLQGSAKPFALLRTLIENAFRALQLPKKNPSTRADEIWERLRVERQMISWYLERGRVALASIVATEWVRSRYMSLDKNLIDKIDDWETRETIIIPSPKDAMPEERPLAIAWHERNLKTARNLIAHAGHASNNRRLSPSSIRQRIESAVSALPSMDQR